MAPIKINFILRSLDLLRESLDTIGIPLLVLKADSRTRVPSIVRDAARDLKAAAVFWNREYEVHEAMRDETTMKLLDQGNLL